MFFTLFAVNSYEVWINAYDASGSEMNIENINNENLANIQLFKDTQWTKPLSVDRDCIYIMSDEDGDYFWWDAPCSSMSQIYCQYMPSETS